MIHEIAVVADLHGNVPAVQALEKDLNRRNIGTVYCLGDIVGKGPSSAETFDWAFQHCQVIVQGNWDYGIGEKLFPNDQFYYDQLGPDRMQKLRDLPKEYSFTLSGRRIRLIHGRPVMQTLLTPSASSESLLPLFAPDYQVVGYADVHRQGMRMVDTQGILFNTGAVGNPLGVTMVQYCILRGDDQDSEAPLDINFVTLPYDRETAVRDTEAAPLLPNGALFSAELKNGIYARSHLKGKK
jgi:predicted phosphodiesterase